MPKAKTKDVKVKKEAKGYSVLDRNAKVFRVVKGADEAKELAKHIDGVVK